MGLARHQRSSGSRRVAAALWACAAATGVVAAAESARPPGLGASQTKDDDAARLAAMVEADWDAQQRRLGREPDSAEALSDAVARVERSLGAWSGDDARARSRRRELDAIKEAAAAPSLEPGDRLALYRRARRLGRAVVLGHARVAETPIVFLKQRRFICQMLHEYVGYYYDYANIAGGGVYVLERPGESLAVRDLVAGRLPRGSYATPALSYDGRTVYFAFCEVRDGPRPHGEVADFRRLPPADHVPREWNYYGTERRCFQIWAVEADGSRLRRLSRGAHDEFDPCPLPDGSLAMISSRRGGYCRCNNPFEPLPTYTLHRMDADGGNVRTLSWHETNEWHPVVLNDGRIAYCRWDYVDRSAAHYHGVWACNPDGSNPHILFGNYTQDVSACYLPRPVPGSRKIAFIAGAHHANVGGSLVLLDVLRARLDPGTGEDRLDALERLTPEVGFPETRDPWPSSYFNTPWPLSEDCFLVAMSFEPLPGMGPGYLRDARSSIYYFDRHGNLELLYRDEELSCVGPIPLALRPRPPILAGALDAKLGDEGEFILSDVRWSLLPLPADRPIRRLRVYEVLPKTRTHVANDPRLGLANAESARMLLGEVPVESDGSAYFRAPARRPLYFQAVDAAGRAVQTMRSVTYLQPGERRSCVGCHEPMANTPAVASGDLLATRRPASVIEPGPDGSRPFCFPRLVQPVLDCHCVRCHDGQDGPGKSKPDLTDRPAGEFSQAYVGLAPFVRWYEWGGNSIAETVTRPGRSGADESRLLRILDDATHASAVSLPEEDRRRLIVWLDGNAPFYGAYEPSQRRAQREGGAVEPTRPGEAATEIAPGAP